MTFKDNILEVAGKEEIIAIVIGEMGWEDYNDKGKPEYKSVIGKLLTWKEAAPILDYSYNTGYGAPDCQAVIAWTETKVIFVVQYDGSTSIHSVPRNPVSHIPCMPGG